MGSIEVSNPKSTQVSVKDKKESATMLPQGNGLIEPKIIFGTFYDYFVEPEIDTKVIDTKVTDPKATDHALEFLKDAVDDWPTGPKQTIHSFYFVKHHLCENPKLKAKRDQVNEEIEQIWQEREEMYKKLNDKQYELDQVILNMRPVSAENAQLKAVLGVNKGPEVDTAGSFHTTGSSNRDKGTALCSSLIKSLEYRIQHESIPFSEEKEILREIKQLEGRRKVIANEAKRAATMVKKAEATKEKLTEEELDGVRKEQEVVESKLKQLSDKFDSIKKEIETIKANLKPVNAKIDKDYEARREFNKEFNEENTHYYENRSVLDKARNLVRKKDIEGLKEIGSSQVESFMSHWNKSQAFRDDYHKRLIASRDDYYKRPVSREVQKNNAKKKNNETVSASESNISLADKVEKEPESNILKEAKKNKTPSETSLVNVGSKDTEKSFESEKIEEGKEIKRAEVVETKPKEMRREEEIAKARLKVVKEALPVEVDETKLKETTREGEIAEAKLELVQNKPVEVDETKLKEIKREEEITKAKLAMDRKKKLGEKAAAKAATWAQKEAEEKLKKLEQKAKKKDAAKAPAPEPEAEPIKADAKVVEPEKADEGIEDPVPSSLKDKERKKKKKRNRNRSKGSGSIFKVILEQKKWIALVFLMLLVAAYYFLF